MPATVNLVTNLSPFCLATKKLGPQQDSGAAGGGCPRPQSQPSAGCELTPAPLPRLASPPYSQSDRSSLRAPHTLLGTQSRRGGFSGPKHRPTRTENMSRKRPPEPLHRSTVHKSKNLPDDRRRAREEPRAHDRGADMPCARCRGRAPGTKGPVVRGSGCETCRGRAHADRRPTLVARRGVRGTE